MTCPEDAKERIGGEVRAWRLVTRTLVGAGWAICVLPPLASESRAARELWESGLLPLLAWGLCLAGSFSLARQLNRSWLWGGLGVLHCFGPAFLLTLTPICRGCGRPGAPRVRRCAACDVPL